MKVIEVNDINIPGLAPYRGLKSPRNQTDGLIIAESVKVIQRALQADLEPVSLLCDKRHLESDASEIIPRLGEAPIYCAGRDLLAQLTGYDLSRGVLCAMRRPTLPQAADILEKGNRICVIYDVFEATNVGIIFRTAAALGYDGIIVNPGTCDPFNRRSVRVSMGAVFQIPWTETRAILPTLAAHGYQSVSMALSADSVYLPDFRIEPETRYALLLGNEGYGLPKEIIAASDHIVKIPMYHDVDSLNVGAAAAIALWQLRQPPA